MQRNKCNRQIGPVVEQGLTTGDKLACASRTSNSEASPSRYSALDWLSAVSLCSVASASARNAGGRRRSRPARFRLRLKPTGRSACIRPRARHVRPQLPRDVAAVTAAGQAAPSVARKLENSPSSEPSPIRIEPGTTSEGRRSACSMPTCAAAAASRASAAGRRRAARDWLASIAGPAP